MTRRLGLVARSLVTVVLVVLLLAGVSSIIVNSTISHRESQQAVKTLNELVAAVANTASIASFTQDSQLAAEVVQGLISNSDVLRVAIYAGEDVLASLEREIAAVSPADIGNSGQIVTPLTSPFDPAEVVGEIHLDANWGNIKARVDKNTKETLFLQIMQMTLVVAFTAAIMFFLVVRPIKAISDRLHTLDGSSGNRLSVPRWHKSSELGQLVGDINALTGRLVATLEQERELQRQQVIARRKYQNLFDHAASGIFVADSHGQLESFNRAFANLTWLPDSERTESRQLTEINWREPEKLLAMLAHSLDGASQGEEVKGDFALGGRLNSERWVHVALLPLGDGNVQGTLADVTQRKQEEIFAKHQAITDPLTGFSNRAGLQHALSDLSSVSSPFAMVMVDLTGFKHINEALGFHIGDQLLLKLSIRLKKILLPGDQAARIDGDEFVLLLAGEHERGALNQRMDQLLELLDQPYELTTAGKSNRMPVYATVGIAFFPIDGGNLNDLLRSAELALTDSEDRNQSSYHYFDPAQQAAVEHRRRLEDDLRHATMSNGLELAFQPIIDLQVGKMTGVEALLRWQHPDRGMISPEVFIPLAEQVGLINQIGVFVLDEACRQAAGWRDSGLDLYVSVNVSVKQIPTGLSPEAVQQILDRYNLPPSAIILEITEGLLMANVAVAQTWIESIREIGVRIYLDDFGTGYSSLSYLKRFPMDTVKIDRSFIRDLFTDKSDRTLVEAIITMAKSLGLSVVAEGVEDEQQLNILRTMGCCLIQGYHFSRPVKGAEIVPSMLRINAELAK